MERAVILDIETTGLYVDEGHKIVSVGMVEIVDGKPTGNTYYGCFNPGRDSSPQAEAVHRLTTEFLKTKPPFASAAQGIRDFIGDAPIIITCRTGDRHGQSYTLDEAFITAELAAADVTPPTASQWVNVRRLSEEMFGQDGARLDAVLNRYGISRAEREAKGHDALLDARLLAEVYPLIKADYAVFKGKNTVKNTAPKR